MSIKLINGVEVSDEEIVRDQISKMLEYGLKVFAAVPQLKLSLMQEGMPANQLRVYFDSDGNDNNQTQRKYFLITVEAETSL